MTGGQRIVESGGFLFAFLSFFLSFLLLRGFLFSGLIVRGFAGCRCCSVVCVRARSEGRCLDSQVSTDGGLADRLIASASHCLSESPVHWLTAYVLEQAYSTSSSKCPARPRDPALDRGHEAVAAAGAAGAGAAARRGPGAVLAPLRGRGLGLSPARGHAQWSTAVAVQALRQRVVAAVAVAVVAEAAVLEAVAEAETAVTSPARDHALVQGGQDLGRNPGLTAEAEEKEDLLLTDMTQATVFTVGALRKRMSELVEKLEPRITTAIGRAGGEATVEGLPVEVTGTSEVTEISIQPVAILVDEGEEVDVAEVAAVAEGGGAEVVVGLF